MDAQEITHQAAVKKVQLGGFNDLLAYVDVPGREPMDQVTGFH